MTTNSKTGRTNLSNKILNRITTVWLEFITGVLWWSVGVVPSHAYRNFFYRLAGIKIGKGSTLHMFARIYDPRHITIGTDTIIGEKVTLDGRRQLVGSNGEITIGNHVDIAAEVMIWTSQHAINDPSFRATEESVHIDDYVFIGPRSIILPGVTIGKGAVIAAGSVVTKSVAPFSVVAGVPAHKIAERTVTNPSYTLGRARLFQ